jgi:hypothetical protein
MRGEYAFRAGIRGEYAEIAVSIRSRTATGPESGQSRRRLGGRGDPTDDDAATENPPRCVRRGGMGWARKEETADTAPGMRAKIVPAFEPSRDRSNHEARGCVIVGSRHRCFPDFTVGATTRRDSRPLLRSSNPTERPATRRANHRAGPTVIGNSDMRSVVCDVTLPCVIHLENSLLAQQKSRNRF